MTDALRYERMIDAPPDVVFEAFTAPGGQEAFYGQDDPGWVVESECDLRVGGVWTITFGPGRDRLYRHHHRFELIDRPRRLRLATNELRPDGSSLDFTTEVTFEERYGRTLMTMSQTGLPAELRDEHSRGVPTAFARLARSIQTHTPAAEGQRLRVLDGRFVLERATGTEIAGDTEVLALVFGPDGPTRMRRDDTAADTWVALWNGDDAHDPEATGMLSAIVAPLAAGRISVWVTSSYDGDLIFVGADRLDEAIETLRRAGHHITR